MVCRAVRFYARKLKIHPVTYQNLRLHIAFVEPGCKAELEWLDRATKARSFVMRIRPTMSEENVLQAAAHETVHMKQYSSGQLTDMGDKVRFADDLYDFEDDVDSELYWFSPWEIEAYGWERGLYKIFLASLKK